MVLDITQNTLQADPLMALLGYVKEHPDTVRCITVLALLLAECREAMVWGHAGIPTVAQWLEDTAILMVGLKLMH
ncbi:hypothetical protein NDU88_004001, partial [Pleurodeles waltl]